jgi:hypothetical protein
VLDVALEIFSPASNRELQFLLREKLDFPRVGPVVCVVKDDRVAPAENGPVDRFQSLALSPHRHAGAFHERRPEARDHCHDMRHACDLGGGDAEGAFARGLDKEYVRIGVAEDLAELTHAAVLVPNGMLRRQ